MKAIYSLMGVLCSINKPINNIPIGIYKPPIVIFLTVLCFVFAAKAQEIEVHSTPVAKAETSFVPLKVGDVLPAELWDLPLKVVHHPLRKEAVTLNDYRDKLLILDFWATWCSSCIKGFPKLHALKEENRENLHVLLINAKSTKDTHLKIDQFLEKRKAGYQFTSVTEDIVMETLFPHKSVPYYVWVYNDRVLAVTGSESITKENISDALAGEMVTDSNLDGLPYDSRLPLFENGNGGETPDYVFKTILTSYVENLPSTDRSVPDENGFFSRITFTNSSILDLFRHAYPEINSVSSARLILSVQDSIPFELKENDDSWKSNHLYNYEARFSLRSEANAKKLMREDLQRFFPFQVTSLEREMECWVLKIMDEEKLAVFPKELTRETNLSEESGQPIFYNNRTLSYLLLVLERLYKLPFIDETGLKVPVKLDLPANLLEIRKLQASLENQGLSLSKQTRKLPVVILSDN